MAPFESGDKCWEVGNFLLYWLELVLSCVLAKPDLLSGAPAETLSPAFWGDLQFLRLQS